jgi:hypothetical protein
MRNAIVYKGVWLTSGSHAHKLHVEGKIQLLDRHMKELDEKDRRLKGEPDAKQGTKQAAATTLV